MRSAPVGLGVAAALRKVGIPYLVLEQRGELSQEGAAIALWGNAMKALEQIGAQSAGHCRPVIADTCLSRCTTSVPGWRQHTSMPHKSCMFVPCAS